MNSIIEEAKKIQQEIVVWRRDVHRCPEVGTETPITSGYVIERLKEMGIEYRANVGGYGVVGLIKGEKEGRTIALRADMDALAIKEETGLPFAATNGNMHACGHDCHVAMLLGAAKILNENRDKIRGNVKLIFQPAEEGPGGAKPMIEDGALENPKVDAVIGLHIGAMFKEVGVGQFGVCYGTIQACLDRFYIKVKGHGCHGALPHTGVDPITITCQIVSALQTIVSRELKPTHPGVVTIGKLHGGSAYNVIPDYVELEGTVRALYQEEREMIASHMESIVAGITRGMQGDYEFQYTFGYPPTVNNPEFTKGIVDTIKKITDEKDIVEIVEPTMGGEDMSYYLLKVPGSYICLGSNNENKGIIYPHHNSKFDVDEDVLWKGTALLAQGAIDWLGK